MTTDSDLPFPLSGRPRCAKHPELECTENCEYGIVGPCGHDADGDAPVSERAGAG
jgi:hypothetical protein